MNKKTTHVRRAIAFAATLERMLEHGQEHPVLPASVELLDQRVTFRLGNSLDEVSDFVDALLTICFADVEPRPLAEVSCGLRELLINAIEHGVLGIGYQAKSAALQRGDLAELRETRRGLPPFRDRRVRVVVERLDDKMIATIADDGEGFDWRTIPDPTDPAYLLREHGRGILLARLSFDELNFNEEGNEVTVVKNLR